MPIKLKANNGNIDLKVPIQQIGGGAVDSVNGMTGDVVLDIPSKTSDLVNDSGFLTSIPSEYVTETELEAKGYLTEHQSLADYAKKSEIPDVSGFLTQIPDEYVTETELDAKGYLTEHQSLAEYAKKSELFSKDYNDLTNKPTIPSVEGLASTQYVDNKVSEIVVPSLEGYATEQWVENKNYLTQHQSLDEYAKKSELFSKDYNDLTNKPTIPSVDGLASTQYVDEKVAAIVVPSLDGYATEQWVEGKGYLTQHQSLADYATKSELATKQDTLTAGSNITIENGVISASGGSGGSYTLPVANKNTLGGVKVIHNSILSSDDGNKVLMDDNNRLFIPYASPLGDAGLAGFNPSYFDIDGLHRLSTKKATISNLGVVKPDGTTITIDDDGVISASNLTKYIKNASVTENTLNLYYNDDTFITFTPTGGSGGGSGGVSGYAFSSTQTLTDADKAHLKEIYTNKNIYMTIDNLTVVRIMSFGVKRGFVVVNTNGATSNQVFVYTVDLDSSGNVTSDTFTLFMSYYLVGNSSALSGDIITSENWSQYISAGGGDWQYTSSSSESNLYNAKEIVLYWQDNSNNKHQSYLNFTANFNGEVGQTLGTGWTSQDIYLDADDTISHPFIIYNGSYFEASSCTIYLILYKT